MSGGCERCAFDREEPLADDDLVEAVERCGACPRLAVAGERALYDRLKAVVRRDRESRNLVHKRSRELTEMKQASARREDRLARLELAHRVSSDELELKSRILSMISAIASAANAAASLEESLHLFLRPLCSGLQMACGVAVLGEELGTHFVHGRADPLALGEALAALPGSGWIELLRGCTAPLELGSDDPRWRGDWLIKARAARIRRTLLLPVFLGGDYLGACVLFDTEAQVASRPRYDQIVAAASSALGAQTAWVFARQTAVAAHERAREAAEGASRAKTDFVSSMSHELRTPLNAILGYGELLHEELTDLGLGEPADLVLKMNRAGRHLLGLINNILDLSKIEAGKMEIHDERVSIAEIVEDVVSTIHPLAAANGNRVTSRCDASAGPFISDGVKIRQILFNLVGNAAKFTHHGTISIDATVVPEHDRQVLRLTVEDTGIGMTEEQLARVFEPFTQADEKTAARYGGTGLGLTLCRRFADLLGGSVQATSARDTGSRFTVSLPIRGDRRTV